MGNVLNILNIPTIVEYIYIYISITSTWDSWEILLDDWKNGDFSQVLERTLRIVDVERKTHV